MINASFRDTKDPLSAQRRVVLERVLQSIWFQSHELEPKVSGPYDELTGGLGVGGRSVYTCFLKFMTSQDGNGHGSTELVAGNGSACSETRRTLARRLDGRRASINQSARLNISAATWATAHSGATTNAVQTLPGM
jgi:hypothetical protein